MLGAAHFRRAGIKQASRRLHASSDGIYEISRIGSKLSVVFSGTNLLDQTDRMSRSSLDSHETAVTSEVGMFERLRSKVTSIVKSGNNEGVDVESAVSSAGLLISGNINGNPLRYTKQALF